MNIDTDCSPDLVYFGFGDVCLTQTYCFLNKDKTTCPPEEENNPLVPLDKQEVTYRVLSNPFRDYVRVEVSQKVLKASIYDVSGRLVYEYAPESEIIDIRMADVANGIYNLVFLTQFEDISVRLSKTN